MDFPGGSDSKESACNAGDQGSIPGGGHGSDDVESACDVGDSGSIPGLGKSPGEGNDNSLQYSCLENSTDRGAWQTTVHGVAKNWTRLSNFHFYFSNWASLVAQLVKIHLQFRRPQFDSWVRKLPGEGIGCSLQYSWASLAAQD